MHRRRQPLGPAVRLATFRGRDLQSVSEAARKALGDQALILRVTARRDGSVPSVEVVAADGGEVERFEKRTRSAPLVRPQAGPDGRPLVVALVGPGGAGKTTTLAKLATHRHAFAGWKVGFLTLDTFRMGALAELRGYAEVTGHPLEVAYDEAEVQEALDRLADRDVILVDTPGRRAVGTERSARWAPLLRSARPDEVHLVLPATLRVDAATIVLDGLRGLPITHLLVTKLDEVVEDRGVADIALELDLPARWVTEGQELPGALHDAPARLVSALAGLSGPTPGLLVPA